MLKWTEYRKLTPLRKDEYNFKYRDTGSDLISSIVSLTRWWVIGIVVELILFLTMSMVFFVPVLHEYQEYIGALMKSTATIGQYFFYIGAVLLLILIISSVIRQVQFVKWKKKYVKKVKK